MDDRNGNMMEMDGNDLIRLGELTPYKEITWKYPNITKCFVKVCSKMVFAARHHAIKHYRASHAKHSALCTVCDKPLLLLNGSHHFEAHFRKKHPDVIPPQPIKTLQAYCSQCNRAFKSVVGLAAHETKFHKNKSLSPMITTFCRSREDTSTSSVSRSPSWEDIDSNASVAGFSVDDTENEDQNADNRDSEVRKNQLTVLDILKRKSRLFNAKQRVRHAFTCTICGIVLKNYLLACSHYRQRHGRAVSMCPFCNRFFSSSIAFLEHMMKQHPRTSMISKYQSKKKCDATKIMSCRMSKDSHRNGQKRITKGHRPFIRIPKIDIIQDDKHGECNTDERETDIILIGESSVFQPRFFRFPSHTKTCPKKRCSIKLKSRAVAISHYREKHAKTDMMCLECGTLMHSPNIRYMKMHYASNHPNGNFPALKCEIIRNDVEPQTVQVKSILKNSGQKSTFPKTAKFYNNEMRVNFETLPQDDTSQSTTAENNPTIIRTDDSSTSNQVDQSATPSKRAQTRSTTTRHKACSLCGVHLTDFAAAVDHYHGVHGRNITTCPYCETLFLQTTQLRKHVQSEHSKNQNVVNGGDSNSNDCRAEESPIQQSNGGNNVEGFEDDVILVETDSESTQSTKQTQPAPASNFMKNGQRMKATLNYIEQPLNLCMRSSEPNEVVMDLSTCALDLSRKE